MRKIYNGNNYCHFQHPIDATSIQTKHGQLYENKKLFNELENNGKLNTIQCKFLLGFYRF